MSISSTYLLASKVKTRLIKETVRTDVNLRRLVCQANMLDDMIDQLNTGRPMHVSFDSIPTESPKYTDEVDSDDEDDFEYPQSEVSYFDGEWHRVDDSDSDSDSDTDSEESLNLEIMNTVNLDSSESKITTQAVNSDPNNLFLGKVVTCK